MQAVELLGSLPFERFEIESKLKQARRVISLKNAAEYEDRLIKQTEAQEMLKDAQRLVEWVENKLRVSVHLPVGVTQPNLTAKNAKFAKIYYCCALRSLRTLR